MIRVSCGDHFVFHKKVRTLKAVRLTQREDRDIDRQRVMVVEKERVVCVTGAGGFQASWLVKLLLSKGYIVHGTVRDPSDEKNAHLKKLEKAEENLKLFKADLLDYDGLLAAIEGCFGVFHVATPVLFQTISNPEVEMIEPAVKGTSYVLKACTAAAVKKVVIVSSISAIIHSPNWPKDQDRDESCWSDREVCKNDKNWYSFAKTEAEIQAFEYGKTNGLNIVSVCPSIIVGPMLQTTMNTSSMYFPMLLKDGLETLEDKFRDFVDVRDGAEALLLVYEKPEAEGRYICSSHTTSTRHLVEKLKNMFPNYNHPKQITGEDEDFRLITSEKLKKLGWKYRSLEETIANSVKYYQEKGILPVV